MQKTVIFFSPFICLLSTVHSQISVGPTTVNFGRVQIGQSPEKYAYIINVGEEPITMSGTGGAISAPFNAYQDCQGATLNPGESCKMTFSFSPTKTGLAQTFSQGTWNDKLFKITVKGTGIKPQFSIAPTTIDFGEVIIGDTVTKYAFVTNVGDTSVVMEGTGGSAGEIFNAAQDCQGATLDPGKSCKMYYDFTPTMEGPIQAVSSGAWNGQAYSITLTGNGVVA